MFYSFAAFGFPFITAYGISIEFFLSFQERELEIQRLRNQVICRTVDVPCNIGMDVPFHC